MAIQGKPMPVRPGSIVKLARTLTLVFSSPTESEDDSRTTEHTLPRL